MSLEDAGEIRARGSPSCCPEGKDPKPHRCSRGRQHTQVQQITHRMNFQDRKVEIVGFRQNSRHSSQEDATLESSEGYGRSPRCLKHGSKMQECLGYTGIHPRLQERVNMVPNLTVILHFFQCGLMGQASGGVKSFPSSAPKIPRQGDGSTF